MIIKKIDFLLEKIKGIEYHDKLNPNLWDNFNLKSDVKDHFIEIANLFFKFLKVDWVDVEDIVLTGSSANYNYTKHSDIDIHLIVDFEKVHKNCPLVDEYFLSKKSLFGKKHDITIKGQPVELYVEDIKNPGISSGVYSLLKNKWIKKPEYKSISLDDNAVKQKFNAYRDNIAEIMKNKENIEEAENILEKIRKMRKSGLEKAGEFSVENIVFKLLRNGGYIDRVKDFIDSNEDEELSL